MLNFTAIENHMTRWIIAWFCVLILRSQPCIQRNYQRKVGLHSCINLVTVLKKNSIGCKRAGMGAKHEFSSSGEGKWNPDNLDTSRGRPVSNIIVWQLPFGCLELRTRSLQRFVFICHWRQCCFLLVVDQQVALFLVAFDENLFPSHDVMPAVVVETFLRFVNGTLCFCHHIEASRILLGTTFFCTASWLAC